MKKLIKVLILDLHGILIKDFPFELYLKKTKKLFEKYNFKFDLEQILKDYGTTSTATQHYGFREEYLRMLDTLTPFKQKDEELIDLIKELQILSYKIYIATDTSRKNALDTLSKAGISFLMFDEIITGDDINLPKPHTELYEKILEKEPKIEPCQMLVIGDRITDIIPAIKLGMNGIVCDFYIFKELLKWLCEKNQLKNLKKDQ